MCVCLCLEMAPESGSIQTAGERDWTGIVLQNPIKSIDFISKVKPFENLKTDQDHLTYIVVIIWDCVGCILDGVFGIWGGILSISDSGIFK